MLEKIGLPAKPSMRGSNWVIDASHCQGCNSQFTLINRKHHCRRCGGLFCGNCTAQRMILRGQGDSPVRICDPCKKIEEAERFELRHGQKTRNIKGSSKSSSSKQEDELLAQILGGGVHKNVKTPLKLLGNESPSSSKSPNEEDEIIRSLSISLDAPQNVPSDITPDELRQKAIEEKKMHRVLKSKGKANEALQAFKRGRELERQADALEITLRKNRRLAASQSVEKISIVKKDSSKKDDLASELRDLGWNDSDLHETDHKSTTLEGELSQIIGEITKSPLDEEGAKKKKKGIDNSEVIVMKKRALMYKKEGRLSEAKEELKKAKILEKQLEEKAILGDSDESDDELGALMRELDHNGKANKDFDVDLGINPKLGLPIGGFGLEKILSGGDIDQFGDFDDVTIADLNDPSLNSDLKSFGWSEDEQEEKEKDSSLVHESTVDQVHALKKEAVMQKKAGNMSEAMSLLKKAKLLEKSLQEVGSNETSPEIKPRTSQLDPLRNNKPVTKNRLVIQRELLAVKKRALALRREGRVEESERELERGRVLERELEEIDNGSKLVANRDPMIQNPLEFNDEIGEVNVSESDMRDPSLASVLKDLGWEEEKDDADVVRVNAGNFAKKPPKKNKLAIQRELLAVKKHALALRREGKVEESDRELERGRVLERELQEFDIPIPVQNPNSFELGEENENNEIVDTEVTDTDMRDPDLNSVLKNLGWDDHENADVAPLLKEEKVDFAKKPPKKSKFTIQRELLAIKKNALALRREGRIEESERELERGSLLEEQLQESETEPKLPNADVAPLIADAPVENRKVRKKSKGEIQRELLALKRKALQLRREGRGEEAESELEKAKVLENELAELEASSSLPPTVEKTDKIVDEEKSEVENDVMDPDILAVTKNSGYKNEDDDVSQSYSPPEKKVMKSKGEIQRELLAIKRKALQLRHEGRVEEAEVEMEKAKKLETQLPELEASSSTPTGDITEPTTIPVEPIFEEPAVLSEENNLKNEILMHKRKALALKREGKLSEAKEELKQAKLLEKNLEEISQNATTSNTNTYNRVVSIKEEVKPVQQEVKPVPTRKPISGRDRFKIQQESLAHKRNALKLRREGKMAESEAEFELAKALEAQLEEITGGDAASSSASSSDNVVVDDFLDPVLMSALKSIGWGEGDMGKVAREEEGSSRVGARQGERERMEEEIKSEKIRAVSLKRAGKTKEAMEALRNAKLMEKKLGLIN